MLTPEQMGTLLAGLPDGCGAAALALRRGDVILQAGVNLSSDHSTGPGSPAPLFLAYSCTKTFIAALVLRLGEEGRLALTDPVSRWFPDLPHSSAITVRHLLNHTSGLPDYGPLAAYHQAVRRTPSRPWNSDEFLARTLAQGVLFEPGKGWSYSNIGYLLLRMIVETLTGERLAGLLAARFFHPLGLGDTFVPETVADLGRLQPSRSGVVAEEGAVDVRRVYHPGWVSHGVVASTPADMAEFCRRLFTGAVLSRDSLAAMTTLTPVPGAPPRYGRPCYGLGIMADCASRFGMLLGHNGGGPGYGASVFHAPDHHGGPLTVCAMVACEAPDLAERLVMAVLEETA